MTMNFFGLPKEIRVQLYSELLVLLEPIVFEAAYGPPPPPLFRSIRNGLCLVLLQVNKQAHSEASSLLYFNNRFRFPDVFTSKSAMFHEAHIKNLELIRDTCISITTLELSVPLDRANYVFDDSPIVAETLNLLETRLKAIPSLKEIVISIDDRVEFDNKEDCEAYDEEWHRREWQREQETIRTTIEGGYSFRVVWPMQDRCRLIGDRDFV
ncbi:hypothetical protein BKA61DRAFT_595926 [Leptodontidium sp. MPI-SDFR-AT-0119]|nr:hypothetical protein BKA61DRAFT_595926 [Leptodontidium sp. MPI-SDFR-AT-0119]